VSCTVAFAEQSLSRLPINRPALVAAGSNRGPD
jgi:hypothetical protein